MMRAIVWTAYGAPEVLQFQHIAKPVPRDQEILIRVHAATVSAGDCEMRRFDLPAFLWLPLRLVLGIRKPRIKSPGQEVAGIVEAVGSQVSQFKPGDAVFGTTGFSFGSCAEYVAVSVSSDDSMLARKSDRMTFAEAAALPLGGTEALRLLRQAKLQPGQKVLIYGAGGSIGTFAIQLAKSYGAEVTGVDRPEKHALLRSIGADHVIDHTREDFTQNGQTYDAIFDVVGKTSYAACIRSLNAGGAYLLASPPLSSMLRSMWTARSGKRVIFGATGAQPDDLDILVGLVEAGTIKPVIDRAFPLEQTAEAHRYVESGRKQGNVLITVREG